MNLVPLLRWLSTVMSPPSSVIIFLTYASADGRGFAVSGGIAQAVVNVIKKEDPTREVKVVSAQGLS